MMALTRRAALAGLALATLPGTPALARARSPATLDGPGPLPGRLVDLGEVASAHAKARRVTVWLPPDYDASQDRHAVLYMHDGQNLFDPAAAYAGQTWGVGQHLTRLMAAGTVKPTLVVGVWNTDLRSQEYAPNLDGRLPADLQGLAGSPLSDGYLRFLVGELKPAIDARFRTRPARADTVVMGSSMGGLISLYALCQYSQVFGGAGALSTHWLVSTQGDLVSAHDPRLDRVAALFRDYLRDRLPRPGDGRVYFDHGTINLDSLYGPYQDKVDAQMRARGYREDVDFMTRVYPGADHNEASWRARLDVPLTFLLAR
ncbi:alpha/beta hydrolase-fold protein [Nitrospirillum sp. BR 11164]|uniref:alpha/beta hydrolase n=1 Tax=Nitrospirillum sp. BR 11164 TaxID=3104324 RepID=UPI002B002199|nr:alpha/beta hydrolase-fold protein [Nitrospirillum sp. BR 11164]MEA1647424.1 alpha/beta hydrolase-fold protein [Nitrospirillum sp. BR 11164]